MGTRGSWGFVLGGEEKLTYNHWDSYPSGLGSEILGYLHGSDIEELRAKAAALRVVQEDENPSDEDIERLRKYADTDVSSGELTEWYVLLRETQGDIPKTIEAGVMIDSSGFPLDSLFCEWAYVINFDDNMLEVYRGFQHEPHEAGRFASRGGMGRGGYYPVKLVSAYSLTELPDAATFVEQCDPPEDDDE